MACIRKCVYEDVTNSRSTDYLFFLAVSIAAVQILRPAIRKQRRHDFVFTSIPSRISNIVCVLRRCAEASSAHTKVWWANEKRHPGAQTVLDKRFRGQCFAKKYFEADMNLPTVTFR